MYTIALRLNCTIYRFAAKVRAAAKLNKQIAADKLEFEVTITSMQEYASSQNTALTQVCNSVKHHQTL
jgi:hypothetical protein